LNRGQRCAERNAVVPEIETINENPFQEQVEVPRVFPEKKRAQLVEKDWVERVEFAVPDRNALRSIARAHAAQEIVPIPKQLEALDNNRGGKQFPFENRLLQDFVEPGITGIRATRRSLGVERAEFSEWQGCRQTAEQVRFNELAPIGFHRMMSHQNTGSTGVQAGFTRSEAARQSLWFALLSTNAPMKLRVNTGFGVTCL